MARNLASPPATFIMKVKVFIATSLFLLSGWLGLAYFHQVDMASYSAQDDANLAQTADQDETPDLASKLPAPDKLGTIVAE